MLAHLVAAVGPDRFERTAVTSDAVDASVTPEAGRVPDDARLRSELRTWRVALGAVFGLAGLGFATWASRVPSVRDLLGLSSSGVTTLVFTLAAGSVIGLALAPRLSARLSSRTLLRGTLGCFACGLLLIGLASAVLHLPWLLTIGVLLFGAAYGANDVIMNVEGSRLEEASGRSALPVMHACFSVGAIVGAGLGTATLALGVGTFTHLTIVGAGVLAAGVLVVSGVPRSRPPQTTAFSPSTRDRLGGLLATLRERQVLSLSLLTVGVGLVEGSATGWLVLAATDGHGMRDSVATTVYGTFVGFMIFGRIIGGTLLARLGRARTLAVLMSVSAAGLAVFIQAVPPVLVFVAAALWGFGASLGFPIVFSTAGGGGAGAARRVSIVAFFGYVAALGGPPALGLVGQRTGVLNAFYLVLVLVVVSLVMVPRAVRPTPEVSAASAGGERRPGAASRHRDH